MIRPLEDNFAPYAPFKAVVEVIKRYRDRGLPDPLTANTLEQIGVASTMTPVTLQALVFLQLIDEGGNRTEAFERLRRANTDEYPQILAEIVRKAYLNVFTIVDPSQDNDIAITDAFRRFEPANQRAKMIRLFVRLCEEAGIMARRAKQHQTPVQRKRIQPRKKERNTTQEQVSIAETSSGINRMPAREGDRSEIATDYRLISAIIQQLPHEGYWTTEKRKRWLDAMTSAIDLVIELRGDSGREESND